MRPQISRENGKRRIVVTADAARSVQHVNPRDVTARYGLDRHGAQVLEPRIEAGIKVFDLTTSVIRWQSVLRTPLY